MNSVLCVYDIADSLKILNPSARFRRWGVRVNLSCWVFPGNLVPHEDISRLREQGAAVHLVEFAEQAQETILTLAKAELRKHAVKMVKYVEGRSQKALAILDVPGFIEDNADKDEKAYRHWRAILSRGRRELLAAEQCAMGFNVSRDVTDAFDALRNLLAAEMDLVLAWRDKLNAKAADESVLTLEGVA